MTRELRALHVSWVNAGHRRVLARTMRANGYTLRQIADRLGVAYQTIQDDLREHRRASR